MDYSECARMAKALSDETRLRIVDMLSCGELCACNLLKHLEASQPTLSYHMKTPCAYDHVICEKRGSWVHYSLDADKFDELITYMDGLCCVKKRCICHGDASKQ